MRPCRSCEAWCCSKHAGDRGGGAGASAAVVDQGVTVRQRMHRTNIEQTKDVYDAASDLWWAC
jgi:hypothetical protein